MKIQHKNLATGRWNELSLVEQLGNVGSEVERALRGKERSKEKDFRLAFYRAIELLDLTVADPKNKERLKEILRVREVLTDYFIGENRYNSNSKLWRDYFYAFGYAARVSR